jgi:hypothetical protein
MGTLRRVVLMGGALLLAAVPAFATLPDPVVDLSGAIGDSVPAFYSQIQNAAGPIFLFLAVVLGLNFVIRLLANIGRR